MRTFSDVIYEVTDDESFARLDLSVFVFPCSTLSNVYDSTLLSLDRSTHWNRFQCIEVDLDVLVLNSFAAYH